MAKFNNLTMSKDLAKDNRISTTKSFFGLCSKTRYDATGSLITGSRREYTAEAGSKIERALKVSADKQAAQLAPSANCQQRRSATISLKSVIPPTTSSQPCSYTNTHR